MASPAQIRQEITDKIIAALAGGTVPWKRLWTVSKNSGRPANAVSRRNYRGINVPLTQLHLLRYGFTSRWFLTYEQAKSLGGSVKKRPHDVPPGEWACKVVFFRPVEKTTVNKQTGEQEREQFPLLRTYSLFSVDQCEGDALDRFRVLDEPEISEQRPDYEPAEQMIRASGAEIRHVVGGARACYAWPTPEGAFPNHHDGDFICLPNRKQFVSLGSYYETLLHEMAHWSEIRTGFDHGTHGYAMGELVAEIAASFVSTELRIPDGEDLANHAAYVGEWVKVMRGDPSYIFKASSWASKTADFLLSFAIAQRAEMTEQAA